MAPALAVALLGLADIVLENQPWWSDARFVGWRILIIVGMAAFTVAFALVMFGLIERAERRVLRQNRDLATAQAVGSAIQGLGSRAEVAAAATRALTEYSRANRVRVRLSETEATTDAADAAATLAAEVPDIRAALAVGDRPQGDLLLWYPSGTLDDRIGAPMLETICSQIAYALRLGQAHDDLRRGRNEGHAFYDVLLQISNQSGTLPTLQSIATLVQRLLGADAAAIIVNLDTANAVRFDSGGGALEGCSDGTSVLAVGLSEHRDPATGRRINPVGCYHWGAEVQGPVQGSSGELGTVWAGRRTQRPFTDRDRAFLFTMAGLADIALTSALMHEQNRQTAVLTERTRIARETHDSHAQVLGAVHLRLRGLEASPLIRTDPWVAEEVSLLADICEDAYADARDVILALREADKPNRCLDAILSDYVAKYSAAYGIETTFTNGLGERLTLSPRAEVEVVRVVQEALTNVRKHADASQADVAVTGTGKSTTFTITDDGVGFNPSATRDGEGYGMVTMRDRLTMLDGTLAITSAPGAGTTVVATVPEAPFALPTYRKTG